MKYFLSNASAATPTAKLIRVALTRHKVETLFREEKSQLGMDHYEGRTYQGFVRHLLLTMTPLVPVGKDSGTSGGKIRSGR